MIGMHEIQGLINKASTFAHAQGFMAHFARGVAREASKDALEKVKRSIHLAAKHHNNVTDLVAFLEAEIEMLQDSLDFQE